MRNREAETLGRKLAVFGFGGLQNLVVLFDILEREGISVEKVREFIKFTQEINKANEVRFIEESKRRSKMWEKNSRRCPTCTLPLMARGITTPKGKGNREGYTCHWYCRGDGCNFEEYSHEDFKEVYGKIMGGR